MTAKKRAKRRIRRPFRIGRARRYLAFALLAALVLFARWQQSGPAMAPGEVAGTARIIDGDSLRIGPDELRLKGIDAPEGRQMCRKNGSDWPCGRRSAAALKAMIGNAGLTCSFKKRDQHGRLLATCRRAGRRAGQNINRAMVSAGWAVSYGAYRKAERSAKKAKRGIWAGSFERPRAWRDKNRRR